MIVRLKEGIINTDFIQSIRRTPEIVYTPQTPYCIDMIYRSFRISEESFSYLEKCLKEATFVEWREIDVK